MYTPALRAILVVFTTVLLAQSANAGHIPVVLDTPALWTPLAGAGYLNFVEPGPGPVGISGTEEYTGWVDTPATAGATGATPDLTGPFPGPPLPTAFDNGVTHGDRVDFDMVVENRANEVTDPSPPIEELHAAITGFMTWEVAPTAPTAHIDPATGGTHSHAAPPIVPFCPDGASFVCLPDYAGPTFDVVDVFSLIADPLNAAGIVTDPLGLVSDSGEAGARDAALDYMLDFCSAITFACAPGIPVLVFVPGWTLAAIADDYVTRWLSPFPATHVLIDPIFPSLDALGVCVTHCDQIVQIDAVVAAQQERRVPEPGTVALVCLALGLLGVARRRA